MENTNHHNGGWPRHSHVGHHRSYSDYSCQQRSGNNEAPYNSVLERQFRSQNHGTGFGAPLWNPSIPHGAPYNSTLERQFRAQSHGTGPAGFNVPPPNPSTLHRAPEAPALPHNLVSYHLPSPRRLFPEQFANTPTIIRDDLAPHHPPPTIPRVGPAPPPLQEVISPPNPRGFTRIAPKPNAPPSIAPGRLTRANGDLRTKADPFPPTVGSRSRSSMPEVRPYERGGQAWGVVNTTGPGFYCPRCKTDTAQKTARYMAHCSSCGVVWILE
ncbi:hypothetical protein F5Y03DRAFT_402506 [Xylaria venustula]|nr:hypothetical protein F5Y03DRAFT_402506 [Xylaria venustula]